MRWHGTAIILSTGMLPKIRTGMSKHAFPMKSLMMQRELRALSDRTDVISYAYKDYHFNKKQKNKNPNQSINQPTNQATNKNCQYCAIRTPNDKKTNLQLSTSSNSAHLTEPVWEPGDTSTDSYGVSPVLMAAFSHPRKGLVSP